MSGSSEYGKCIKIDNRKMGFKKFISIEENRKINHYFKN